MYVIALIGSAILLVGAFPRYTSRPDLFPGIDTPTSCGGLLSIGAGVWAVAISWQALRRHQPHDLEILLVPAAFTGLQLLASLRLMTAVAYRQKQPVGAGPGLWLSVAGAVIIGYAAFRGADA